MTQKSIRFFVAYLALAGLLALPSLARAVSYNILAVSYTNGDTAIHIGSQVTVNMVVVAPVQQFNVSITAVTTNTLTLGSLDFNSIFSFTQMYVTDGQRVWEMVYNPGSGLVTIGNGFLVSGAPVAWQVADYSSLANQSFRVYSGQKISQLASGSTRVLYADLGAFAKVEVYDDGASNHGDAGFNDGLWSGIYNVQDLGFVITGARFYGVAGVDGVFATNQPFQSPQTIDMDCLLPTVTTIQFTTNKPTYNGVLYISRQSQLSGAFQPSNAQGRFDFTVNKRGVAVGFEIKTTPSKILPEVTIPPSASNNNGWNTWDGLTGNNVPVYAPDGVYAVDISIRDFNGVGGITRTTQVQVTSLLMELSNITLSPSSLQTEPAFVNGVITRVSYRVTLRNDANDSIQPALAAVGWNVANFNQNTDHTSWVHHLPEVDFLKPDGSIGIAFPGWDATSGDGDKDWLYFFRNDLTFQPFPNCYFSQVPADNIIYNLTSGWASVGDANNSNDMDLVYPFQITGGISSAPTHMQVNPTIILLGDTPEAGSYRLRLRSVLTGLEAFDVTSPELAATDVNNYCAPLPMPPFLGRRWHFVASAQPQGKVTSDRGKGFNIEDSSVLFSVSKTQPPTSDTTAPVVITSDPLDDSEIEPGDYSSTKPLSVQVQDNESAIAVDATRTNLRLYYRSSNDTLVPVGGIGNPDGGNPSNQMVLYFKPNVPIIQGGNYVLEVNACNVNGLCVSDQLGFVVQDRSAPSVVGVELKLSTALSPRSLTLGNTSPDGPYDNVEEIYAQLAMPLGSSNKVDWASSSISLVRSINNTTQVVPLERIGSADVIPSDGKLRYRLVNSIDYAGLFEVIVQTFATDASGNAFSGPEASFVRPRFTTLVNSNVYKAYYPLPSDGSFEAITGQRPLTITSNSVYITPSSLTVQLPAYTALPTALGYLPLTATAASAHGIRFNVVGTGLLNNPLRFDYDPSFPVRFKLYYSDADLVALGVSKTALTLLGLLSGTWQPVNNVIHDSLSGTRNTFTLDAPLSADTYVAYGIFYSVPSVGPGALATATAIPFKHTRSFNPMHSNPIYRKARFFYSSTLPSEVDVRIFDSGGTLIKAMSLGNGVNVADLLADSTYNVSAYFFEWDGRNDSDTLVRNGLYLARWKVVRADGTTETVVKPLALIK